MVKELTGGYVIKYHANGLDKDPIEIDFTPPFRSAVFSFCAVVSSQYVSSDTANNGWHFDIFIDTGGLT